MITHQHAASSAREIIDRHMKICARRIGGRLLWFPLLSLLTMGLFPVAHVLQWAMFLITERQKGVENAFVEFLKIPIALFGIGAFLFLNAYQEVSNRFVQAFDELRSIRTLFAVRRIRSILDSNEPFVLYLRSFQRERGLRDSALHGFISVYRLFSAFRDEHIFGEIGLQGIGVPVVTLVNPNDIRVTYSGGVNIAVDDECWEEVFRLLANKSSAVLLRAVPTNIIGMITMKMFITREEPDRLYGRARIIDTLLDELASLSDPAGLQIELKHILESAGLKAKSFVFVMPSQDQRVFRDEEVESWWLSLCVEDSIEVHEVASTIKELNGTGPVSGHPCT